MRRTIRAGLVGAVLAATLAGGVGVAAATPAASGPAPVSAGGQDRGGLYTLTSGGTLTLRDARQPVLVKSSVKISGLAKGDALVGLDRRPANNVLYALGRSGQIYTVDGRSGKATPVGQKVALQGSAVGFDFNPVVDRIRIVTTGGQNLRVVPDTGATTTDGSLNYVAGDPAAGKAPSVSAAAYRNPVAGATSTELYGIDTARDTLVEQDPPNDGVLTTVGRLGLDARSVNGFDIAPGGRAVASLKAGPVNVLAEINLDTGKARPIAPLSGSVVGLTFTG